MERATSTLLVRAAVIAVVGSSAAACSFILNFAKDDRPCAEDSNNDGLDDCLPDYSCLFDTCVINGSVAEDGTCAVHAHCGAGHVCTTDPFVCREDCNLKAYGNTGCGDKRACIRKVDPDGRAIGACVPTECTTSADCPPVEGATQTCVEVTSNVGVCDEACSVNCNGGVCNGSCGVDDDGQRLACQPLGKNQTLACVPEGSGKQAPIADQCNMVDALCNSSHACVMSVDATYGVCLRYCNDVNPTACIGLNDPQTDTQADCNLIQGKGYAICGALPDQPIAGPYCQEACDLTSSCNDSYECKSNRCVDVGCTTDETCRAEFSGWEQKTCGTDADCFGGVGFCIAFAATTYCVIDGSGGCTDPAVSIDVTKVGDGSTVQTCGNTTALCGSLGSCEDPCTGNPDCTTTPYLICDDGRCVECLGNSDCTGSKTNCVADVCGCKDNSECVAGTDAGTLCMASGQCGCIDSSECASGTLTTCDNGICVCTDTSECTGSVAGELCTRDPSCGCSDAGTDCTGTLTHTGGTYWVCE